MATDREGSVLVVESRPVTRGQLLGLLAIFGLMMAFCLLLAVAAFVQAWPKGPEHAIPVALLGVFLVGFWPLLFLVILWADVGGTWELDGDGVVHRPARGEAVAIRWKDVERVHYVPGVVALRSGRTTLKIPFNAIDEPARSKLRARIEAILKLDFDLAVRPWPDPLDGVEPAWWNRTLRAARIAAVSLSGSVALLGSLFWVSTRYPERGAWQGQAVFLGWMGLLVACIYRYLRMALALNPTWRHRIRKAPGDDLGELL
jgi:hypothetical protein